MAEVIAPIIIPKNAPILLIFFEYREMNIRRPKADPNPDHEYNTKL